VLGKERERFLELCGLAANEQDPHRLLELVKEINNLLEAKGERLKQRESTGRPKDSQGQD
jgi:hypothetical protein